MFVRSKARYTKPYSNISQYAFIAIHFITIIYFVGISTKIKWLIFFVVVAWFRYRFLLFSFTSSNHGRFTLLYYWLFLVFHKYLPYHLRNYLSFLMSCAIQYYSITIYLTPCHCCILSFLLPLFKTVWWSNWKQLKRFSIEDHL